VRLRRCCFSFSQFNSFPLFCARFLLTTATTCFPKHNNNRHTATNPELPLEGPHNYTRPFVVRCLLLSCFFIIHTLLGHFPFCRLRRRRRRCRRRCQCQPRRHIPRLHQLQQMNKFLLESRTRCHASFS